MTLIKKAMLVCNVCGDVIETDPALRDPFYSVTELRGKPWEGWMKVDEGHHLCPACASVYREREEEMRRELRRYAGIDVVELEI